MPDWLLPTAFVALGLTFWIGLAVRNTRKQIATTLARRPNPSREQFIAMMRDDVQIETAEFLWATMVVYLEPRLTPHPDDDLVNDLPIDDDDWSMDWPRAFAEKQGLGEGDFPDWPKDRPVTVRNFGSWLDSGRPA